MVPEQTVEFDSANLMQDLAVQKQTAREQLLKLCPGVAQEKVKAVLQADEWVADNIPWNESIPTNHEFEA